MLQGIQMRIRCRRFDWVIARRKMDSAGSVNWKNSAVGTLCPDILAKKRRTLDDRCAALSVSALPSIPRFAETGRGWSARLIRGLR
jgi:hypothetical protein